MDKGWLWAEAATARRCPRAVLTQSPASHSPQVSVASSERVGVQKESPGALGTSSLRKGSRRRPCPNKRGKQTLAPRTSLLSDPLAPLGTVVGFRGRMESLGGKRVAGNGPREANLEAPTPGESLLWPSQDALLLSGALAVALPSSPPPRPVRSKQGGSWGTPWQGPLACGERSGGLAGSESVSHDHPS